MTYADFGIRATLERTGGVQVSPAAEPNWRLTPSWEGGLQALVRGIRPQLLIGTWSWDSPLASADPEKYERTLDAAIRQWLTPGDGVVGVIFLEMPALGSAPAVRPRAAGVPAWNEAVQKASLAFPGRVMYLPVASSLEIDGQYTTWLPPNGKRSTPVKHWVRVRTSDGVHLCPPGITRYAAPVLEDLTELFHLPPATGDWWNGYIVAAKSLINASNSFALTCPDDHPPT